MLAALRPCSAYCQRRPVHTFYRQVASEGMAANFRSRIIDAISNVRCGRYRLRANASTKDSGEARYLLLVPYSAEMLSNQVMVPNTRPYVIM